ncbi:NMT1/THI5 like-domain-containing protein [Powellomyces hirtus]|nr:NMT1/THI5 like-domain-containing protein [Powellomyces hirtus]
MWSSVHFQSVAALALFCLLHICSSTMIHIPVPSLSTTLHLFFLLVLCPRPSFLVAAAACQTIDKISLQLNWIWQAQFAGFQAASTLGYYQDECLGVQIRQGDPTFDGLSEVTSKRAVFGNSWTSRVAASHAAGANVTIVMQQFQRSGMRIVSRLRPDIVEFKDLDNKTISAFTGNLNDLTVRATMAQYNMRNVTLLDQSFTPFKVFATDGTAVDGVSVLVYNELAQIYEKRNPETGMLYRPTDVRIFDFNDLGTAMLEDDVFVRSDWLAHPYNQNITRRFVRATAKGWIYCRDHELECTNFLSDHSPHQEWMMREVNRLIWPSPLGVGAMDLEALAQTVEILNSTNTLTGTPCPYRLSDDSYMQWALNSLKAQNVDVVGASWDRPSLHFCMNSGQTTYHTCDEVEATVCPPGHHATAPNVCSPCPPGSFSPSSDTGSTCIACSSGTYSSRILELVANPHDQDAAVGCLGCPAGTRTGPDGRIICGKSGFEDTIVDLVRANKVLMGAWALVVFLTGATWLIVRRNFPMANARVVPETVATLVETTLDMIFLKLLVSDTHPHFFAIAMCGFCAQVALNVTIVFLFVHYELQQNGVRSWAEHHVNVLPPVLMLGILNPQLMEILASRFGHWAWTQAPLSSKGCAALRFCTFAAFLVGKTPQVCVQVLILERDGWHLSPFLASVTNLALLARGSIHYLLINTLFLYRLRTGEHKSNTRNGSRNVSSLFGLSIIDGLANIAGHHSTDVNRVRNDLENARRRVRELEERLREFEPPPIPPHYKSGPSNSAIVLASSVMDVAGVAIRRTSGPLLPRTYSNQFPRTSGPTLAHDLERCDSLDPSACVRRPSFPTTKADA